MPRYERTRWMFDQTLDFLESHTGKPCFVNLWFDDVHTSFRPAPGAPGSGKAEAGPKSREYFDAVLAETDRQIELYDLEADPGELRNLAGGPKYKDVEYDLKRALTEKTVFDWDFLPAPLR